MVNILIKKLGYYDKTSHKWYVCSTIGHEMAHMWFGNLISCQWWDEKWVNEGFASYFQYVGLEESPNPELAWDPLLNAANWDLGLMIITRDLRYALNADQTTRYRRKIKLGFLTKHFFQSDVAKYKKI